MPLSRQPTSEGTGSPSYSEEVPPSVFSRFRSWCRGGLENLGLVESEKTVILVRSPFPGPDEDLGFPEEFGRQVHALFNFDEEKPKDDQSEVDNVGL